MLIVLPFCNKDGAVAVNNVRWIAELDGKVGFECLLSWPEGTQDGIIVRMREAAAKVFQKVHEFTYPEATETTWPAGPNWAWQRTAEFIRMSTAYKGNTYPLPQIFAEGTPWLFLEPDAVPLKPGWMQTLFDEYKRGDKPFMGNIVTGMGHMNGVAVYPNHVALYARDAMHAVHSAWDAVLREQTIEFTHKANHLIQHCWVLRNNDTPMPFGDGPAPSFRDVGHMTRILEPNAVLFHRTKDGTLIDCLMQARVTPAPVAVPISDIPNQRPGSGEESVGEPKPVVADSSGPIVIIPTTATVVRSGNAVQTRDVTPVPGSPPKVSIFIVTYHKDAEWLKYCLFSIKKFAQGFLEVVVMAPDREQDIDAIDPVVREWGPTNAILETFTEEEGKGMLHHMAIECMADQYCRGDFILHTDSDCLFIEPVTPADYIIDGRPVLLIEAYERFRERYPTILEWQRTSEAALKFPCEYETMRRHPAVHLRATYPGTRQRIEKVHGKPFLEYVLSCKPNFPQGFSEFNVLGAYALKYLKDEYQFIDVGTELRPKEKIWQGWSHGGFERPSDTGQFIPDTPRQVFKKVLGI